jgi:5-methylthioribose kinase
MLPTLTPENLTAYLQERSLVPAGAAVRVEALGWGISNVVLKVTLPDDCFVVKQPLPKLRVADDWPFDRSRIFIERDCMALLGDLLPAGSVPQVRFSDDENYLFGMSCAPEDGDLWEQALLEGRIDVPAAARAGVFLAEMHNKAAGDSRSRERFDDITNFIQGRIDPYHRTTAKAHPDLAPLIDAEVERMLGTRRTLVHGDYSPKNIFICPDHMFLLDFEVAHYGDPAFDAAFCLNHLVLPALRFPERSVRYLEAAQTFRQAYFTSITPQLTAGLEAATVRELGCLMLARIDGKSKIPYITDEPTRDRTRRLARNILTGTQPSLEPLLDKIERDIALP